MKIAEILLEKGYNFKGKKMWLIAIDKALKEDSDNKKRKNKGKKKGNK